MNKISKFYKNKKILITGVAGTIGSALAEKLIEFNPKNLYGLDNNESRLFDLSQQLSDGFTPILGDVRDPEKLIDSFKGIDIVFHAAALKHVPLCEKYPLEAFKTNVIGLHNVISAAKFNGVSRLINTSSDKAVNPTNVMGTTKLLGEHLIRSSRQFNQELIFACVRFGNVLGSSGSVIPIFYRQIREGSHVTLTSHEMTRFIMNLEESILLLLETAMLAQNGDFFLTKMSSINIKDLADVMIEILSPKFGKSPDTIEIREVGLRSGEKLYEELMTFEEAKKCIELDRFFVIKDSTDNSSLTSSVYNQNILKYQISDIYDSKSNLPMSKIDLKNFLVNSKLI